MIIIPIFEDYITSSKHSIGKDSEQEKTFIKDIS